MTNQILRFSLIGGAVVGLLVCAYCYAKWRKNRDRLPIGPARDAAATLGKLTAYNSLVLFATSAFFMVRYLVLQPVVNALTEGIALAALLMVWFLIIIGLCLPGIVSLITFRTNANRSRREAIAEERGMLAAQRNQTITHDALVEIRDEQRKTRDDLSTQESLIRKELGEEQDKLREGIAKRDTLKEERDAARDEADALRDENQGTDIGQGQSILDEQGRVRREKKAGEEK